MNKRLREGAQDKFKSGEIRLMIATLAFGMGIDIPNVRAVIHDGIQSTFEDAVQQYGRGGRDGLPCECVLIPNPKVESFRRKCLDQSNPAY